jgi:iron complex transport system substrate-binding protein
LKRSGRARTIAITAGLLILGTVARAFAALQDDWRATAAQGTRIVTDDVGRVMKMPAHVNRIVTLAPNLTEIVYALGLGDKLAGDTSECDNPPAAKLKPHVGEPQNPSLEAILALHPDLVLATTSINRVETADALVRLGVAVYTSDGEFRTLLGILDSMGKMAEFMGAKRQGDELVSRLRQRLDALHARLENRPMVHVLFVVWKDPLITIGQNTFIADGLRWAGAESVVLSKQNWPQISIEEVVHLQPDYIVFAGGHAQTAAAELADLRARPVWRDLDAVELGHVANLNEEAIRPAPGLVDAIEQLAHELHPEAFPKGGQNRNSNNEMQFASAVSVEMNAECHQCAR